MKKTEQSRISYNKKSSILLKITAHGSDITLWNIIIESATDFFNGLISSEHYPHIRLLLVHESDSISANSILQ